MKNKLKNDTLISGDKLDFKDGAVSGSISIGSDSNFVYGTLTPNEDFKLVIDSREYEVDWDEVKTVDDIKEILKLLNMTVHEWAVPKELRGNLLKRVDKHGVG